MTLEGFIKKTKGVQLAKANALLSYVRELEMGADGSYTAFVDDGKESFDVRISLDEQEKINESNCDCGAPDMPCVHIMAVAQALINNKNEKKESADKKPTKEKKIKPKKLSPVQSFTEKLSKDEMLLWLYAELERDKTLFAVFKNHFEDASKPVNIDTINEFMNNAIKAVINKRKTVQLHELVSIINLWKPYVDKVFKDISSQIFTESNILCVVVIYEQVEFLKKILVKSTSRIDTFYKNVIHQTGMSIANLTHENQLTFFENYLNYYKKLKIIPIYTLLQLVTYSDDKATGKFILNQLRDFNSLGLHAKPIILVLNFLDWLKKLELLKESLQYLTVERYNNDFNAAIINNAIHLGEYKTAATWCLECAHSNYYEEYNVPYYNLIEKAIETANDKEFEYSVRTSLRELRTSYKDFLFLYENTKSETDLEKLLESYTGKYVNAQIYKQDIIKIKIRILLIRGRHDMAIKKIDNSEMLLGSKELWDDLYKLDNELLLKTIIKILNKESSYYSFKKVYHSVIDWLLERYEDDEIFAFLNANKKEYFKRG